MARPVVSQPGVRGGKTEEWMPLLQQSSNSNCPPGLEYLLAVDQLIIQQKVERLEAFIGIETANKYTVRNNVGQKMYYAAEISDSILRAFVGSSRPFDMKIVDNSGRELINLKRPFGCTPCCFTCCLQSITVYAPVGTVVGSIQLEKSCNQTFSVKDASGETVLTIKPDFKWCGNPEFHITSRDGSVEVGKITKEWSGLARELFTDADTFGIFFPLDLDVKMKAVLLGACFLIDYAFFESSG